MLKVNLFIHSAAYCEEHVHNFLLYFGVVYPINKDLEKMVFG